MTAAGIDFIGGSHNNWAEGCIPQHISNHKKYPIRPILSSMAILKIIFTPIKCEIVDNLRPMVRCLGQSARITEN